MYVLFCSCLFYTLPDTTKNNMCLSDSCALSTIQWQQPQFAPDAHPCPHAGCRPLRLPAATNLQERHHSANLSMLAPCTWCVCGSEHRHSSPNPSHPIILSPTMTLAFATKRRARTHQAYMPTIGAAKVVTTFVNVIIVCAMLDQFIASKSFTQV